MVIVQTCKRPGGVSYLAETLRSIGNVGERKKVIISDGPLPDGATCPDDWMLIEFSWHGARETGWTCMRIALDYGAKDLILLQDDIVVCDGGAEVMDSAPTPENAIATTFYSPSALPGLQPMATGPARFIVIGASGTAQALKIPRHALGYLCGKDPRSARHIQPTEPHLFDDSLFALARESPWPHVAHLVPNVVRHVGMISACGTRRGFRQPWSVRRGEKFPGGVDIASPDFPKFEIPYTMPEAWKT